MTDPDPRPLLHDSFAQAAKVVGGVSPDQLTQPTPCTDFDVSALLGHLAGVGNRIVSIGRGEPQARALLVPEGDASAAPAAAFESARSQALAAWAADDILERTIELPFGTFSGAVVAQIYALELTTHAWDLASATDQLAVLDDELAEVILPIAQAAVSPEYRGGAIPFQAVVPVAEDAPVYERLAGFLGRSPA